MALVDNIQTFLQKKLQENKLSRKNFAQESQIPYTTVNKMINAIQLNPELITILKIAYYFNCSTDEVIGRIDYYPKLTKQEFKYISLEQINLNLRDFITSNLQKNNLNPYKLGRQIGFSEHPIAEFIQENSKRQKLSTAVIVALADYFKISIDEMIGRISSLSQESQKDTETIKKSSKQL